jgi:hypothetical protein
MLLTHYYHQKDRPFKNLSALEEQKALSIIRDLQCREGLVYRRFNQPEQYLKMRKETEIWARQSFIEKGGKPNTSYPQYFVVNQSVWIEEGFNQQSFHISFPISDFNPKQVSFTFPDSMVSYWLRSQTHADYYHPEYHGQVFLLDEICQIINQFGIPDREWQTEESRKYDLFIEAQVWDDYLNGSESC